MNDLDDRVSVEILAAEYPQNQHVKGLASTMLKGSLKPIDKKLMLAAGHHRGLDPLAGGCRAHLSRRRSSA